MLLFSEVCSVIQIPNVRLANIHADTAVHLANLAANTAMERMQLLTCGRIA